LSIRSGPAGVRALVAYVERGGDDLGGVPMDPLIKLLSPYQNPKSG
jgi:hypothetical protein